jgi:hypothetical protein
MLRRVFMMVFLPLLVLAACEDVPVHDVSKTFAVEVSQVSESAGAIKLDILWIIDNSASMCQEQWTLARSFSEFKTMLSTYLEQIDIRLAVVTTNVAQRGEFRNEPAETFPPACVEQKIWPCLGDADCEKKYGEGWQCSSTAATDLYNLNGSVNSTCTFHCGTEGECCQEFCFADECGDNSSCIKSKCKDMPSEDCTFTCRDPNGTTSNGCQRAPDTKDCPSNVPKVLTMQNIDLFKCIATVPPEQKYSANMEQGLKTAWWALNPNGPNQGQSAGFLRPDAYLVIVFVSDEDDCSIDEAFAAPNSKCEKDSDCTDVPFSKCKLDVRLSQINGKETKLCTGTVKKDYYNVCSLLGDYKGSSHHSCAYDMGCNDCSTDSDCDYGWYCKQGKKCRPKIFNFPNIASYQVPPGHPIFALAPVSDYYSKLRSLKSDPAKVLVAAITGDGLVKKDDKKSLISQDCLENKDLLFCQDYQEAKKADKAGCDDAPEKAECEAFREIKGNCVRDCYVASKGNAAGKVSKNTYICESQYGKADFGSRYVELARMFGPNGLVSNICSEEGIAPALKTIAELIIKRVTKICLPLPVKPGEQIVVTKTVVKDGVDVSVRLKEGEPGEGDYKFEFPTQDCCDPDEETGECRGTLKAITFNNVLEPTATIEVKYEAVYGDAE